MPLSHCATVSLLLVAALSGCDGAGDGRVLAIEATGLVEGFVYFDANGNREPEVTPDSPLSNVRVVLVARGTIDTVREATSAADGSYSMPGVPVGSYTLIVDTTTVGDTVEVVRIDTAVVELQPGDSVSVTVAISYPKLAVVDARALPQGSKVFVEGIALNSISVGSGGTFGDTTVHIAGTLAALRATNVRRSTVILGDTVRFLGTMRVRDGEPVIDDVEAFFLGIAATPPPELVTTAGADSADGGRLDAGLVRLDSVTILDTASVPVGVQLTVDDGSGQFEVLLDSDTGIDPTPFVPSVEFGVEGLLVPTGSGNWRLKPRSENDLSVLLPAVTVQQAKTQGAVGDRVLIVGVALNSWETFGDSTVHVSDATGAIRATRVDSVAVMPGDTVRVVGTLANRDGQRVLDNVTPTALANGLAPSPTAVSTLIASAGASGFLDAALVSVSASISDTGTVLGGFELSVSDGSGALTVLLDGAVGFDAVLLAQLVPGANVDLIGLLVPDPLTLGRWILKPRQDGDVTVN